MFVTVVLAAGGKGTRMGINGKKQYMEIMGKPVLAYSLELFASIESVGRIVLVIPREDLNYVETEILKNIETDKIHIAVGGESRQESVRNGIFAAGEETEILVVHDGARPFATEEMVLECIESAVQHGAATSAVPVKDTIKCSNDGLHVESTLKRDCLYSVQTPQAFRYDLIKKAHLRAVESGFEGTDDAMLVETCGGKVVLTKGSYENIKLTSPEDVAIASVLARRRKELGE